MWNNSKLDASIQALVTRYLPPYGFYSEKLSFSKDIEECWRLFYIEVIDLNAASCHHQLQIPIISSKTSNPFQQALLFDTTPRALLYRSSPIIRHNSNFNISHNRGINISVVNIFLSDRYVLLLFINILLVHKFIFYWKPHVRNNYFRTHYMK